MTSVPAPAPASGRSPTAAHRGFTVAELVVALALTSLIVLLAGRLLVEAVEIAGRSERRLEPLRLVAVSTALRADLHRSAAILAGPDASWQLGTFELAAWDGTRVRYLLEGDRLLRESLDAAGLPAGRRSVAGGVTSWWWRRLSPSTVEIRVSLATPGAPAAERAVLLRRFSVRGWPDGRSW